MLLVSGSGTVDCRLSHEEAPDAASLYTEITVHGSYKSTVLVLQNGKVREFSNEGLFDGVVYYHTPVFGLAPSANSSLTRVE